MSVSISSLSGLVPNDGIPMEAFVSVHPALTGIYITLASGGIAFAIACLVFTFVCRNTKYVCIVLFRSVVHGRGEIGAGWTKALNCYHMLH